MTKDLESPDRVLTISASVADPLHFDVDPDPRIHFREKWIRIRLRNRPKIGKISIFSVRDILLKTLFFVIKELIIHVY